MNIILKSSLRGVRLRQSASSWMWAEDEFGLLRRGRCAERAQG